MRELPVPDLEGESERRPERLKLEGLKLEIFFSSK
jgi:hypothetical protein